MFTYLDYCWPHANGRLLCNQMCFEIIPCSSSTSFQTTSPNDSGTILEYYYPHKLKINEYK